MRPLRMLSLTVAVCFVVSSAVHAQFATELRRITTLTSLTLSATSVIGGPVVTGTVSIDPAAGSSGVTVKLVSSNPAIASVPPSVVVQPGTTTGAFIIQSHPVAGNPNVISDSYSDISAQVGSATPKLVRLTVRPPSLSALSVDPATVTGGVAAAGTVTISGTAPAGGLTVSLSATGAETETDPRIQISSHFQQVPLTTVPAQLTVPAGATTATFPISTRPVTQLTSVEIKAAYGAFVSRQASLTLKPPAISSVTLSNTHPIGGESVTVTAAMSGPAPSGVTFAVSISGLGCGPTPVVPSSVQFPAGAASASFTATTQPGGWSGKIHVGYIPTADDLYVRGLIIGTDALTLASTVTGGTTVTAQIKTVGVAGPSNCGNSLTLSSSNALYAQVPEKVVLAPGTNVVTFPITTTAVPAPQTVTISVHGNTGYAFGSRSATLTLTP